MVKKFLKKQNNNINEGFAWQKKMYPFKLLVTGFHIYLCFYLFPEYIGALRENNKKTEKLEAYIEKQQDSKSISNIVFGMSCLTS